MASLSSIYHKVCPACAGDCAEKDERCACGYRFAGDGVTPDPALAEELLYEDYLKARAEQAHAAAAVPDTVSATRRAEAELRAVQADLDRQRERIGRLRHQAPGVPLGARSEAPRVRQAAEELEMELGRLRRLQANPFATGPVECRGAVRPSGPTTAPVTTSAGEASPAPSAVPAGVTGEVPPVDAGPVLSALPQAELPGGDAEPEVRAVGHKARPSARPLAAAAQGEADVRRQLAAQAERAAQRLKPGAAASECPNCTAQLAANVRRCKCGFEMPAAANLMPAVPIDAADLSSLSKLLQR